MRKSICCVAPVASHGARRRICLQCKHTWTIRQKRKGRKKKRARKSLATAVIGYNTSLRGLAQARQVNRETLRRRFHKSLNVWVRSRPVISAPSQGALVAVIDALWFKLGKKKVSYGCFVVLLKPVNELRAYPGLLILMKGKEGRKQWEAALRKLPGNIRSRIIAVISDGCRGLDNMARNYGWHFQWCHVHMKRKMSELRGVRKLPGRLIRQRVNQLVHEFLEVPDERNALACLQEIRRLFDLPDCPPSLPSRLKAIMNKPHLFRTYRLAPELNLPVTTNSVEQINQQIRRRFSLMRGVRSLKALKYWLQIVRRTMKPIKCNGYKQTIRNRKKFYTISVS